MGWGWHKKKLWARPFWPETGVVVTSWNQGDAERDKRTDRLFFDDATDFNELRGNRLIEFIVRRLQLLDLDAKAAQLLQLRIRDGLTI